MKVIKSLRIEPDLWDKAMKKAHKLQRSLSGQIRHLLMQFIKDEH